jgi:hypothetical protein
LRPQAAPDAASQRGNRVEGVPPAFPEDLGAFDSSLARLASAEPGLNASKLASDVDVHTSRTVPLDTSSDITPPQSTADLASVAPEGDSSLQTTPKHATEAILPPKLQMRSQNHAGMREQPSIPWTHRTRKTPFPLSEEVTLVDTPEPPDVAPGVSASFFRSMLRTTFSELAFDAAERLNQQALLPPPALTATLEALANKRAKMNDRWAASRELKASETQKALQAESASCVSAGQEVVSASDVEVGHGRTETWSGSQEADAMQQQTVNNACLNSDSSSATAMHVLGVTQDVSAVTACDRGMAGVREARTGLMPSAANRSQGSGEAAHLQACAVHAELVERGEAASAQAKAVHTKHSINGDAAADGSATIGRSGGDISVPQGTNSSPLLTDVTSAKEGGGVQVMLGAPRGCEASASEPPLSEADCWNTQKATPSGCSESGTCSEMPMSGEVDDALWDQRGRGNSSEVGGVAARHRGASDEHHRVQGGEGQPGQLRKDPWAVWEDARGTSTVKTDGAAQEGGRRRRLVSGAKAEHRDARRGTSSRSCRAQRRAHAVAALKQARRLPRQDTEDFEWRYYEPWRVPEAEGDKLPWWRKEPDSGGPTAPKEQGFLSFRQVRCKLANTFQRMCRSARRFWYLCAG